MTSLLIKRNINRNEYIKNTYVMPNISRRGQLKGV